MTTQVRWSITSPGSVFNQERSRISIVVKQLADGGAVAGEHGLLVQLRHLYAPAHAVISSISSVVPFRPLARDDAVLPGVPWTHHELPVEPALGQWAALVVAGVADRPELAVMMENGDRPAVELESGGDASSSAVSPRRCHVVMGRFR